LVCVYWTWKQPVIVLNAKELEEVLKEADDLIANPATTTMSAP
jgi:hypothetical protein